LKKDSRKSQEWIGAANSLEEVYSSLKEYDSDNKLSIKVKQKGTKTIKLMELKISEDARIIAYTKQKNRKGKEGLLSHVRVSKLLMGKELRYFYTSNLYEVLVYFLNVFEERETFPTEEEWKQYKRRSRQIVSYFVSFLFLMIAEAYILLKIVGIDTSNWGFFPTFIFYIGIIALPVALLFLIDRILTRGRRGEETTLYDYHRKIHQ